METVKAKRMIYAVQCGQSWFGVTHNVNIYRGCDHGCIYCDSRSSCYRIHQFDRIRVKERADQKIDHELSNKRKTGVIGLGGMNDPYNRFEAKEEYTRRSLMAIDKHRFGVHVITKSDLVTRDIDLFQSIMKHSVVNVGITITTIDDALQQRIERNVSSTSERFAALQKLRQNGIFSGVLMMPLLPFINDTIANVEGIVKRAKDVDACYIYPSFGVTLRDNQRQHFFRLIGPELTERYVKTFGEAYMCQSPQHKTLRAKFEQLCDEAGILYRMADIVEASRAFVQTEQLSLF